MVAWFAYRAGLVSKGLRGKSAAALSPAFSFGFAVVITGNITGNITGANYRRLSVLRGAIEAENFGRGASVARPTHNNFLS